MIKLEPYIRYNGNCEEAFNFYKGVFGGEFTWGVMYHKDNPQKEHPIAKEDENRVLHIALPVGKTVILMGADTISAKPVNMGDNISIAISTDEIEEVKRLFTALSAGGNVTLPLQKTFWAELYGEFTDKFGIKWIISHAKGEDV